VYGRVVDIGGCLGSFLQNILSLHPSLNGVLFDLPAVIDDANEVWQDRKFDLIRSRTKLISGSFFNLSSLPAINENDVILMRMILHDWNDQDSKIILSNLRHKAGDKNVTLTLVEVKNKEINKYKY
jgi:hypothetical protein